MMQYSSPLDAPAFLDALAAIVDSERQKGVDRLGERVATRIAYEWGGAKLYIKKDLVRRNRDVYERFNGRNHNELALLFRLSENTVRIIIAKERERRRPKPLLLLSMPTANREATL